MVFSRLFQQVGEKKLNLGALQRVVASFMTGNILSAIQNFKKLPNTDASASYLTKVGELGDALVKKCDKTYQPTKPTIKR